MAFIDIDYLQELGYQIPQSSVANVQEQLDKIIEETERIYFQNTIGYSLTAQLYALVDPLPPEVVIFLDGNAVDGDAYYKGIKPEIAAFIMARFYGELTINVNNSGFSTAISDGEQRVQPNFIVDSLVNYTKNLRPLTYNWLIDNANDFFADWECDFFNHLQSTSVW